MNFFRKRLKSKGFTLLEILMVLVLISILAALAIPHYSRITKRGHASEAVTILGNIRAAQIRYYAQYGVLDDANPMSHLDIGNPNLGSKFNYELEDGDKPENMELKATPKAEYGELDGITVTYKGGNITIDIK